MPGDTPGERSRHDHYAVLGVLPSATLDQIIRAYRRLARSIHPDADAANPAATERFERLAAARDVLTDPARRAAYDRSRKATMPPAPPLPHVDRSNPPARPRGATVRAGPVMWVPDRTPRGRRPGRAGGEPR